MHEVRLFNWTKSHHHLALKLPGLSKYSQASLAFISREGHSKEIYIYIYIYMHSCARTYTHAEHINRAFIN